MICGTWRWVNRSNGQTHVWFCQSARCCNIECRRAWAQKRIQLMEDIAVEYGLDKFFTLTIDRSRTLEESWKEIPHIWSLFRKRVKRMAKYELEVFSFVAVLESHEDGFPHIHGVTQYYMCWEMWKAVWMDCGGGSEIKVKRVEEMEELGEYLGKELNLFRYIGKQNLLDAVDSLPSHTRTIWRSKGLSTPEELFKKNNCLRPTQHSILRHKDWNDVRASGNLDRRDNAWMQELEEIDESRWRENGMVGALQAFFKGRIKKGQQNIQEGKETQESKAKQTSFDESEDKRTDKAREEQITFF